MRRDVILALVALLFLAALGSEAEGIQARLGVGKASCSNAAWQSGSQSAHYGVSVTDLVRFTCDLDDLLLQSADFDLTSSSAGGAARPRSRR